MTKLRVFVGVLAILGCPSLTTALECDPHNDIIGAKVSLPGEKEYNTQRMNQYSRYMGTKAEADTRLKPSMLVECNSEIQIQNSLAFAKRCGFKVVIRGGGHSYVGLSSCSGGKCMQLDVSAMNDSSVDDDLLTAGPGVRLINFFKFMGDNHLALPHGVCTNVGLGGHLQSSAYGPLSHAHGSGLDHVEGFRIVLANGTLLQVSRHDADNRIYKSILGSSPGSWGVITQYTIRGIRDRDQPTTTMLRMQWLFTKDLFVKVMKILNFIAHDQERRNKRDMRLILFAAPPSRAEDIKKRGFRMFIRVHLLWTGIDSGELTKFWTDLYVKPLLDLKPLENSTDPGTPLSKSTLLTPWENGNDRYAMQDFISDRWWTDEFIEKIGDYLAGTEKLMPWMYPSFQFNPAGYQTQWARNEGMNSLTWRKFRSYADDWMFVKNESLYPEAIKRMRDFRESTRSDWEFQQGPGVRSTFMSPQVNVTDLRNPNIARQFFPNITQFKQLQALKAELDPEDLFSNPNTIPLPESAHSSERAFVI